MRPAPAIATVADDFNPLAVKGHNQSPFDLIRQEIEDLYEEAKNWADGEPIASQEMHDAIERLRESLHDAGKRADALRVEEKRPLDEKIKTIQDAYNPLIQPKRGKVDLAKSALDALLTPWRTRIAQERPQRRLGWRRRRRQLGWPQRKPFARPRATSPSGKLLKSCWPMRRS